MFTGGSIADDEGSESASSGNDIDESEYCFTVNEISEQSFQIKVTIEKHGYPTS